MHAYYIIALIAFLVLFAALFLKYVGNTVDRQFRDLAQASSDEHYRRERIAALDAALKDELPLPANVAPLPGPASALRNGLPTVLTIMGVIFLWGSWSAPPDQQPSWLYGGIVCLAVAAVVMLVSLRRRRWARTARNLLFRADLKRMDGDRKGSAEDLRELLRLTPWDDSAWAELSDDLAACKDLSGALSAMEEASRLDPKYDEYHMVQASLAIRQERYERARDAVDAWRAADDVADDDPRLAVYRAAIELGEGKRDDAVETLARIALDDDSDLELLDSDQALEGVRGLLPGRE